MKWLIILMALGLTGCIRGADPISKSDTGNRDVDASLIGKVDGCNVWRVHDGYSQKFYFVRCPDGARGTSMWQQRGKSQEYVRALGDKD